MTRGGAGDLRKESVAVVPDSRAWIGGQAGRWNEAARTAVMRCFVERPLAYVMLEEIERTSGLSRGVAAAVIEALAREGLVPLPNAATWFTCIDLPASGIALSDAEFAERAVMEAGVASIPVSALCEDDPVTTVLRLCHCKPEAMLSEAVTRLARLRDALAA